MYFNAKVSVIIKGQAIQTVVSVSVKNDGNQIGSYCEIVVPMICRMEAVDKKGEFTTAQTNVKFSSGDPVLVTAQYVGYDWVTISEGYVYDFKVGTPITIKCIDEIYFLNKGLLNLSYKITTFQKVMSDVLAGTGITVAEPKLDFQMENLTFPGMSPAAILQWFKKNLVHCMTLNGKILYANVASNTRKVVILDTSINVLKSDLQKPDAIFKGIRVKRGFYNPNGTRIFYYSGDKGGTLDEDTIPCIPDDPIRRQKITDEVYARAKQRQYSGTVETMLYPDCDLFWKVIYNDIRYPVRSGNYTIQSVEIDLSEKGYRRKLKLAYLDETETINGEQV